MLDEEYVGNLCIILEFFVSLNYFKIRKAKQCFKLMKGKKEWRKEGVSGYITVR